ncbi:MAG: GNAT family protein [Opitutaceae bacterium]
MPDLLEWLQIPRIRDSFHPLFPDSVEDLARHLLAPEREYLAIAYKDEFVGTIGTETIDLASGKAEMRKLVGKPQMRGKGIGKRATFLFLYHAFAIRGYEKIYLHTLDANIRNLNLNANFGFILEGVFFEDVVVDGARRDVVRMALTEPVWRKMFE